jgi:hypothetical protein
MSKLSRFIDRKALRVRKVLWAIRKGRPGHARPVFILGAQRSGTTILIESLNRSLETEVHGEASPHAMRDWRIRDAPVIEDLISNSPHRIVIFKPLTDSHRAGDFLSLAESARAIWMYRNAADRANSAVAQFGSTNLDHLSGFVRGDLLDTWQAQGLSDESMALLRRFNYDDMSPHSAAALFWYIRNILYFEQQLDSDTRVLPLAYEDLVTNPAGTMRGVSEFIGCTFEPVLYDSIHGKSLGRAESNLAPEVDALCATMYERLRRAQAQRLGALGISFE